MPIKLAILYIWLSNVVANITLLKWISLGMIRLKVNGVMKLMFKPYPKQYL
jgi:hypothetical protein